MPEAKSNSSHGSGPYGERSQRNLIGVEIPTKTGKTPLVRERGFFDPKDDSATSIIEPITPVNTELIPRKLKLKAGATLYKVVRDSDEKIRIPFTPAEAGDLFDRTITVPTSLDIPVEYLEKGKRGGTAIIKVGQSDYGAFTVVLLPVGFDKGEIVTEERLASFTERSQESK